MILLIFWTKMTAKPHFPHKYYKRSFNTCNDGEKRIHLWGPSGGLPLEERQFTLMLPSRRRDTTHRLSSQPTVNQPTFVFFFFLLKKDPTSRKMCILHIILCIFSLREKKLIGRFRLKQYCHLTKYLFYQLSGLSGFKRWK